MKLTTRGLYSLKALIDLSLQVQGRPCSARAIAERQNIPVPYLEKLLIQLRQAHIVRSIRGAQGGYELARSPKQIGVGEILRAVQEPLQSQLNLLPSDRGSAQATDWVTQTLWQRLSQKLIEALDNISLEDLYYDARSWQAAQGEDNNFIV